MQSKCVCLEIWLWVLTGVLLVGSVGCYIEIGLRRSIDRVICRRRAGKVCLDDMTFIY